MSGLVSWIDQHGEGILKFVGSAGAVGVAVYKGIKLRQDSRASLRADLAILKLIDKDDPNRAIVKAQVDATIARIYSPGKRAGAARFTVYRKDDLIPGIVVSLIFLIWTGYLLRNGINWWAALTGFFMLVGFSLIGDAFTPLPVPPKVVPKKDPSVPVNEMIAAGLPPPT